MHVGERPYVVVGTQPTHISTHPLNVDAMTGMLMQLLPPDAQRQLNEFGAAEHELSRRGDDRFKVVAARGADDIWVEIRRRRPDATGRHPVRADHLDEGVHRVPHIEPQAGSAVDPIEQREPVPEPSEVFGTTVSVDVDIDRPRATASAPGAESDPEFARHTDPAVVVPMTRTVRIEVPAMSSSTRATTMVDRLLHVAAARGASALFLTSDVRPFIRVEGDMRQLETEPPLSRADVEGAILEIAPDGGYASPPGEPREWIAEFEDVGRLRCTTFVDYRGPGLLLRIIATRAATADQLGLPREVQALATEPQGLVLVGGPRRSGKSTLLSALVDLVNRQRAEFVVTIEREIRLVHDNKAALISQREIRGGAEAALKAARAALRESPDVLVIDDMVSPQMVPLLLAAASEGLLVIVSLAAPSACDAVQRFIEMTPGEARKDVQAHMAESFRGAVAQVLVKKSGGGQIAAREILLATAPVTRLIGEGQLAQLPLALEGGRKHGMVSIADALAGFVRSGAVDVREAFRKTPDRAKLLDTLKRDGIDTSAVERLA